ncbi:MAG: hypothetical protein ACR650_09835 [Methylocystis sp.]
MSFRNCISAALNDGAISKEEADDLVRRFEALEKVEREGMHGPGFAKAELARQLSEDGLRAKRRKLLAQAARRNLRKDIDTFNLRNGANIMQAAYAVFEDNGSAGFRSLRNRQRGLLAAAHAEAEQLARLFERKGLAMQRRGNALFDEIVKAGFGESDDAHAQALYDAFLKPAEKLRNLANEAGAEIGWRKDWGFPTSHTPDAVRRAGLEKWKRDFRPLVDWAGMTHAVSGAPILENEIDDVLDYAYQTIVSGGWNKREPGEKGQGALWARRSDPRFFKFKNAQAWRDYNKLYGKGDVGRVIADHLRSMANDVALMQVFGPNPLDAKEWLKQYVRKEAEMARGGAPYTRFANALDVMKRAGAEAAHLVDQSITDQLVSFDKHIDALFDQAAGTTSIYGSVLGDVGAILRLEQYGSKVGSAFLPHVLMNPPIQLYARWASGVALKTFPKEMWSARPWNELSKHEALRGGLVMSDMLHVLEGGAREAGLLGRMRTWMGWAPALASHLSGLDPFLQMSRRAAHFGMMADMADHVGEAWKALPARERDLFTGYGFDERDWRLMQRAELHHPSTGSAAFLRHSEIMEVGAREPEAVKAIFGEDADPVKAANEVAQKYLEFLQGQQEVFVPSSSWRAKAFIVGDSKAGTWSGEFWRSVAMFKSFAGSLYMNHWRVLVPREMGRKPLTGAAVAGAYLMTLTVGEILALQLKSLSNGKDPRDFDPTKPEGQALVAHAMLAAGGLGIFGDFLSADKSSYGHDFLSTFGGPVVTGIADLLGFTRDSTMETLKDAVGLRGKNTKEGAAARALISTLRNDMPVLSTHWALKAAYNRIALDQLQYILDPQAHQHFRDAQRRIKRETGQGYWWAPGEMTPGRLPELAQ